MSKPVSLFTLVAAAIALAWWWLGAAVTMPPSPLAAGEKMFCVSYAPFRGLQTPLDLSTMIEPWQIEEDFAQLAKLTDCVRTYSVDFGLDKVPEIARRHGLKVMLGVWVSNTPERVAYQVKTGVALTKQYPDVIRAVVVGNEVLLRGEFDANGLAQIIRSVKEQVTVPVTYADVWEFWLRNGVLADVVDFITIHILPYWEDDPIRAADAADHVDAIHTKVVAAFPNKEIIIGEVGWPSAGRMREGALPSPANQARVVAEVLERSKRGSYRANLIESYDQPWKRFFEGTVGGHWGLIGDSPRRPKFAWGEPVSNHPHWIWQALGGIGFAALVFAAALMALRRPNVPPPCGVQWTAIAATAGFGGFLVGWTIENVPLESLGFAGWSRSLALTAVALATPVAAAAAIACGLATPAFARLIGPVEQRTRDPILMMLGWASMALTVLAIHAALGLTFNPRYLDFPFAPLTAAAIPLMLVSLTAGRGPGGRPVAEMVAAGVLVLAAVFIVYNETVANWQAVWTAAALVLIAVTLPRAQPAPG